MMLRQPDITSALADEVSHEALCQNIQSSLDLDRKGIESMYRAMLGVDARNVYTLRKFAAFLHDVEHEYTAVRVMYERALAEDGSNVSTLYNYGCLLKEMKEYEHAQIVWEKALKVDPKHVMTLSAYGIFLHDVLKNNLLAEVKYKAALDRNPTHEITLFNYGVLLKENKRYDEACEMYSRLLNVNPSHLRGLQNYAVSLCLIADYPTAGMMFQKALDIEGKHVLTLINYATMLTQTLPKISARVIISPNIEQRIIPKIRELLDKVTSLPISETTEAKTTVMYQQVQDYEFQIKMTYDYDECPIESENNCCLSGVVDCIFPVKKSKKRGEEGV